MATRQTLAGLAAVMTVMGPAAGSAQAPAPAPVTHEDLGRTLDDLAARVHGLGERFLGHFAPGESRSERPLVTFMLDHRQDLGLTPAQVEALDRIRADFQREAIKLDADQRVAQMDVAALLRADQVDLAQVEAKVREVERLRADLRLGRIRAIEQGKAQLTADQRAKLRTLLASDWMRGPRAGEPVAPPPPRRL
jgi:Spy/CpxP family protein refolding chaperone